MINKYTPIRTSFIILFHLILAINLITTKAQAQTTNVGVNTSTPKATLDVTGTSTVSEADGVLVPRITRANLALKDAAYGADQNGAMVFITDISGSETPKTTNITATGFYFYNHSTTTWKSVNGISTTAVPNFFIFHSTSTSNATFNNLFNNLNAANPTPPTTILVKTAATFHITIDSFDDEGITYELFEVTPTSTLTFSVSGSAVASCSTEAWSSGAPISASMSYTVSAGKMYSLKSSKTGGGNFTSNSAFYTSFYAD